MFTNLKNLLKTVSHMINKFEVDNKISSYYSWWFNLSIIGWCMAAKAGSFQLA